ncbi:alpha/beta hydrolase [Paenibacillus chitinolyticus]|uniref:Alpha/beta hydrolase n=1 Tax=Paenibacillus chitinolyticus TaxID=79263 RepID=A0A410WZ32_9BACL|nr:alpha/beta hydrolase [Paenibacillus chitinolyticus]MCY9590400.1 alpha/beta hydrolase [Paenibacillus chitinolyticus]MCY9596605.1 alpha/beta hydrolase [Paenibacillus chitinolyticus]QAV19610.1 alpha/beta hydrolase [Paenibacillus chitinolyticus]
MDLFYEVKGEGTPLVFIHSPGVDSREWKFIAPILAQSFQVITFDGRGTGKSPAPTAPANLVEDLKRLLHHLNIEQAVLVGHSMGGQAAADFALTYPSMVSRLILLSPSLSGFPYSKEFTEWIAQVNSLAPDLDKMIDTSLAGPNYRVVMSSPQRDFLIEMHTDYMRKVFTEWKSFEVNWPQPPAMERLEEISAPTLFLQGTVEWGDMERVAEEYKRVPSCKFIRIEGADHMLTLTHPAETAGYIEQFLKELV